ncbi:glutamine--fructose-6-phosphate transaminase (isomerizing) [Acetobacter peroxydans]|jgi:glucosamine--fructose-6-phosphate aminotransferase (isomerizing)|uniref:glutamine--fructose-6-phosphate transaminase (isomerizing) n=1 Tax=Acetobacter peroxydans TaxID=104098 RepID=UPI0023527804|nr:glutamine--fructose-6-phosphate transaminase (isomerizing) [Acetobacter peroxydans]MCH4143893.1 glutamine--fructose-6-phosphate transaminase (isomerizing) [Acetobacter peroxydans]MCI1395661.1 glutamine--fructose-6-phosphate transaminase (isomerizing) [Acetobacter peroxydans]MCI1410800.1 glutamine--fructose-6-phosphate transaminase (isomerizing) [Acetobacter peroxydans]MCI1440305.1 glutamine--fructose-6-phosphate transaminase (isomerizing) [Acetobacter peroxydans]MCI1566072.1 glutamine--fruc
MCGICGATGLRHATPIVFEGLRRLEYRGYDSAGIATLADGKIERRRAAGKLDNLAALLEREPLAGTTGIGHTRWATHGAPTTGNAHPHGTARVAIVHNGIIENFETLRRELETAGQVFETETDSETIALLVDYHLQRGLSPKEAALATLQRLEGAYAVAMVFAGHEGLMIGACHNAPLAVGYGEQEMFLGSDSLALAPLTRRITYMENGDCAILTPMGAEFIRFDGTPVQRAQQVTTLTAGAIGKDGYRHYMEKELHEHPLVIGQTLQRMVDPATRKVVLPELPFNLADAPRAVMTACGSAFYAGMVGRYWLEEIARLPVDIDVASELRYRNPPLDRHSLGLLISQSGETADTLAALRALRQNAVHILSVLNVEHSSMARESDAVLGTVAGPEISVASTKAFTAQLTVLACLSIAIARARGHLDPLREEELVSALLDMPTRAADALAQNEAVRAMARVVAEARDVLYLGRGSLFPVAMEGALKLKEISYIHAEAYAAGEMKHGPISLIDSSVPIVASAPYTPLFDKTLSNLQEAKARGGRLLVFTDTKGAERVSAIAEQVVVLPHVHDFVTPILQVIPVQMLAYEVAVLKGTDVDQPRNLAKSVTVE